MILETLAGALTGGLGAIVPAIVDYYKTRQANEHELAMMQEQRIAAKELASLKLEEIGAQADADQTRLAYAFQPPTTGIRIIDAINALVRPSITYWYFGLYAGLKISLMAAAYAGGLPLLSVIPHVWTEADMGMFAAIMAFWFGSRALLKHK